MIHTEEYKINSHDCDFNGEVRPSSILRYMNETANLQMLRYGPTNDQLRDENKAFVLCKVNIVFHGVLRAFDAIRVETWAVESRGLFFNRCSRVWSGEKLIAEMTGVFALVGLTDKKFFRVDEIKFGFDAEPFFAGTGSPSRFRIPEELKMEQAGEYVVGYSRTDENMHMNNTYYLDVFCDYLPDPRSSRVVSAEITYQAEAPLGTGVKVYRGIAEDGAICFRTVLENGKINSEASIHTE